MKKRITLSSPVTSQKSLSVASVYIESDTKNICNIRCFAKLSNFDTVYNKDKYVSIPVQLFNEIKVVFESGNEVVLIGLAGYATPDYDVYYPPPDKLSFEIPCKELLVA